MNVSRGIYRGFTIYYKDGATYAESPKMKGSNGLQFPAWEFEKNMKIPAPLSVVRKTIDKVMERGGRRLKEGLSGEHTITEEDAAELSQLKRMIAEAAIEEAFGAGKGSG